MQNGAPESAERFNLESDPSNVIAPSLPIFLISGQGMREENMGRKRSEIR